MVSVALRVGLVVAFLLLPQHVKAGNEADQTRLKQVIKDTIKPKPVKHKTLPPDVQALLAWSKPVNGLAARIEYVWAQHVFFVRLKNVSDRPLIVPMANPSDKNAARSFELYVRQGTNPWRRVAENEGYGCYFAAPSDAEAQNPIEYQERHHEQKQTDWPLVTLQPGEDCIAWVVGWDEEDSGEPKVIKVVLPQADASAPGRWSGLLETPPRAMDLSREQYRMLRAALPFPKHFPPLTYDYSGFINQPEPDMVSSVELLHGPNRPCIDMVKIYAPAGLRKEFERRMRAEKVVPMKLLLASVAAAAGSEDAAIFFLETMKATDYFTVINLHYALHITYWYYLDDPPSWDEREPPDWLVELSLAIFADNRLVTGMEKTNWGEGTRFTVSSREFGGFSLDVSDLRCRKAVPFLIERLKKGLADFDTIDALGATGDARAIPALIDAFNAMAQRTRFEGDFDGRAFSQIAHALGKLKAREAVPSLLKHIEDPEIVTCLGDIGDRRAVPALSEIVAAKRRVIRDGKPVNPKLDGERLFAAKVTLAQLDAKNEALRLIEILADPTLERNHRYDVVLRLAIRPDPRAIPSLIAVIKANSDHQITEMAIDTLSQFKRKAAVEGLIECFDVPFKNNYLWKGKRVTPATYRNQIARSLQTITGQAYGADKQQWLRWWHEHGQQDANLKWQSSISPSQKSYHWPKMSP